MDKLTHKFIAYYTEASEMIKSVHAQSMTLYLYAMYKQFGREIETTNELLSIGTGIGVNTVNSTLEQLKGMRIISYDKLSNRRGVSIDFNADQFVSLITAFSKLPDSKRQKFTMALSKYDFESITDLGFILIKGCGDNGAAAERISFAVNHKTVNNSPKSVSDSHKTVIENECQSQNCEQSSQICDYFWQNLVKYIGKETLIQIFSEHQDEFFTKNITVEEIECLIDDFSITKLGLVNHKTVSGQSQNCDSIYKEKEEIEKMVEAERSEDSYIGGEEKNMEDEKENNEESFGGLERIELVGEKFGRNSVKDLPVEPVIENPYLRKSFFKTREVEEMISHVELCIDSPVKLLIYNFMDNLYDSYYCNNLERVTDEDGNESEPESSIIDMIGTYIPEKVVEKAMENAYEDTNGDIEKGMTVGDVKVSAGKLPEDFNPFHILDWKTVIRGEGMCFIVSLDGFRNIESEEIPEIIESVTREERRLALYMNLQYAKEMQNFSGIASPMESMVVEFFQKFVILDEDGRVIGFMNGNGAEMDCRELPGYIFKPWVIRWRESGIEPSDFYAVMNLKKNYKHGQQIDRQSILIKSANVSLWNSQHGWKDAISQESLRSAAESTISNLDA